MSNQTFDAVSLSIMWDRLVSLTDEIVSTLVRSSFSTIVYESYDLSVVVLDAEANSIAQGTFGIPAFIGSAPVTLRHMLKRFPAETLKPGDIVVTNDPWLGTGHLFDITMMRPVFRKGRIVAYTVSITHLPDIGGTGFGSAATEIYQEGLRIPICKLYDAGKPNDLLIDIIRTNVRVPEQTMGDIMANVSCNEVGAREINAFMDEYGLEDLMPLSRAIRGQSETAMRAKLRDLKDGTYRNRIKLEGFEGPVEFAVRIDVEGDNISFDYDGTSGCVRAGVNVPFCYTNAMSLHAIKSLTLPTIPNNAGSQAPVRVSAPVGCILNAQPPFPTGGRHAMGHFVTPLVYGALADAIPGEVQADSGMMNLINFQGRRRDGRGVLDALFRVRGLWCSERPRRLVDAAASLQHGGGAGRGMGDADAYHRRAQAAAHGLGGTGRWRGGLGQEVVLRNDTGHPLTILGMGNRWLFPAKGVFGGGDGTLRVHAIDGTPVHAKGRLEMAPGQRISVTEAGGAGYGDPKERDREAVAFDVANGFVSREAAATAYGWRE